MPSRADIARTIAHELTHGMQRAEGHDATQVETAQRLWGAYVEATHPRKLKKPKTHAAAVHYALSKSLDLGLTQKRIARIYSVSKGGISRIYRHIWRTLDLDAGIARFEPERSDLDLSALSDTDPSPQELRHLVSHLSARRDASALATIWQDHAPLCLDSLSLQALTQIAIVCEPAHPSLAAEIAEIVAARHVDGATRTHYRSACEALALAKRARLASGEAHLFSEFITFLWEDAGEGPLRQEMQKAGLSP